MAKSVQALMQPNIDMLSFDHLNYRDLENHFVEPAEFRRNRELVQELLEREENIQNLIRQAS